jgi:predicted AAA+ superfamily ATPase
MLNRKIIGYLEEWKNKKVRKPLILRGARQVGKTSAVLMFAGKHFENLVHLNLEKPEHSSLFPGEVSLSDFEKIIQIRFHTNIIPGKTLIFIDEIQNSQGLLKLLRFFYEEKPDLHVVAAGSLFQAKIDKERLALPVGRVEYAYLYPMDFFEYLEAKRENELLKFLRNISIGQDIPAGIHGAALRIFYEYTMIGGMPEIVKVFTEEKKFEELKNIYSSLFTSYLEDVYKYSSTAGSRYLRHVIEKAPFFAGTNVTYEKFGESNYKSREMGMAFELLEKVMLLYQVQATKSTELPLIPQKKRPKKLLFLDAGLMNYQMGIQESFLNLKNLSHFYRGKIAEQIVGQNILAQFTDSPPKVFYWAREKPKGSAEVDFCLNNMGNILGIEIKSGKSGKLRSLFIFGNLAKESRLIRIYDGDLKTEKIKVDNKALTLLSIPFYLTPRILELSKKIH